MCARRCPWISSVVVIVVASCSVVGCEVRSSRDLTPSSRADAAKLLKTLDEAGPVLVDVSSRTSTALTKAAANEIDAGYLSFVAELGERRPITSEHVDGLDYAAFDIETIDGGFELERLIDRLWTALEAHRSLTETDLAALRSLSQPELPVSRTRFGVVLRQLDSETLGASIGVLSNPSVSDGGVSVVDVQTRPGRKAHAFELYRGGPSTSLVGQVVIPIDDADCGVDGPLGQAERSHMTRYVERISELHELTRRIDELRGELLDDLRSTAKSGTAPREMGLEDAVESGRVVHREVTEDLLLLKNLKSRVAGAARKAIDADRPSADLELLGYLSQVKGERPFAAKTWSRLFYQSFRSAPLLFEHSRSMGRLWDLVAETAARYEDPLARRALVDWPAERQRVLELNAPNGAQGHGIAFRKNGEAVVARVGVFRSCRRERVGRSSRYLADWTPLAGGEAQTLEELQPGLD